MLFVLSWVNLAIQAPVHAGMKQAMMLADYPPCHCPETFCDLVLDIEDQSDDVVHFVSPTFEQAQFIFIAPVIDTLSVERVRIHIHGIDTVFKDISPPPLEVTGILLI